MLVLEYIVFRFISVHNVAISTSPPVHEKTNCRNTLKRGFIGQQTFERMAEGYTLYRDSTVVEVDSMQLQRAADPPVSFRMFLIITKR